MYYCILNLSCFLHIMLEFGHVNIRSITANFHNFRNYLLSSNYDIFALTETWLAPHFDVQLIAIPGFNFCHLPRQTRGGGVGFYIKSNIKFHIVLQEIKTSIEEMWVKFVLRGGTVVVGVVYRPGGDIPSFISNFENSLSSMVTMGDEVVILGDFNINAFNMFGNAYSALSSLFESFCFKQLITEPTRITPYSATLIDYILIHSDAYVVGSGVRDVRGLADHCVVYCVVDIDCVPSAPVVRTYRDYTNFNMDVFNRDLYSIAWDEILYFDNIDDKVLLFNQFLLDLFDRHAPFISRTFNKPFKPWYTDNIHFLMKRRDSARQKYNRTNNVRDLNYYRQLRNYTTYAQRQEKKHT